MLESHTQLYTASWCLGLGADTHHVTKLRYVIIRVLKVITSLKLCTHTCRGDDVESLSVSVVDRRKTRDTGRCNVFSNWSCGLLHTASV